MKAVHRRWPRLEGSLARLIGSCVRSEAMHPGRRLPAGAAVLHQERRPGPGFNWRQQGFGAYEALLCYWDSIDTGDRSLAEKAVRYNEDDCLAMWHVDQKLTGGR